MLKWIVWFDTGCDYVSLVINAPTRKMAAAVASCMSHYGTWPIMAIQEA